MRNQRGFSTLEMLVATAVLVAAFGGLGGLLLQNARINKQQRLRAEAQADARACLALIVPKLRSAGWDPTGIGIAAVTLDPDTTDDVDEITVLADLDEDGSLSSAGEQLLIRRVGDRVEWQPDGDPYGTFQVIAVDITNDADGDGVREPMFVPDSTSDPTRVTVRITARSPARDPVSGDYIRYTVSSEVVFRKTL